MTGPSVRSQLEFEPDGPSLPRASDFPESELLACMSHEMRTPLSAILGFAQLMESCTPPPTVSQKRSIELILQAGWHLDKLINMARDLALLQSGAFSLSLDIPVSLAAVMQDVEAMIHSPAQMRGIRVIFPLLEAPCFVLADGIRLQQVLGTLLSAAIEHSEVNGTVVLDCDTRSSKYIRIGIHGGQELSGGRRDQRFQARENLAREAAAVQATGIGLLLARRLVESMGGAICAESTVGTGKVFSFDLKRMLAPPASPASFKASETMPTNAITG
jgi:signal transduction histidine kinase